MHTPWYSYTNQSSLQVFDQVYALLVRFSEKIQSVDDMIYRISSSWGGHESRTDWERFIRFFQEGTYFHYRCQGYMEALRVTGAYTPNSVNIWVNQLVYPAANNFTMAMQAYQSISKADASIWHTLNRLLKEFKPIAEAILQYANRLNTLGPGYHPDQGGG
jgi:hypothetical protein